MANGLEQCPQCNADLECFDLLDALQDGVQVLEARTSETGKRMDKAPFGMGNRNTGLAAGFVLLLVLVPLTAFVGNRYLGERVERLEIRLASTGDRTGSSQQEATRLHDVVEILNSRIEELERLLANLPAQQIETVVQAPWEQGLNIMQPEILRIEGRLATIERQQDVDQIEHEDEMTELTASIPSKETSVAIHKPQPVNQSSLEQPSVAAISAQAFTFTDYHAAPEETLWRIARRFYGKGIYYPVLLEDNPGLAIHGSFEGRALRIARQREHAQETYRRLVFSEGGHTLFRYRARAGDSSYSLARAFYGDEGRAGELAELHGTTHPEVGRRVLIPLD